MCNTNINEQKILAIDGTCSNDIHHNVSLNMGYYDVNSNLVLDLTHNGHGNRNKEIKMLTEHILENKKLYKNVTIVGDRAYFSYVLMTFLEQENIKYIIRCRGTNIKNTINVRVVSNYDTYEKMVYSCHKKRKQSVKTLVVRNNCILLTTDYNNTDDDIMKMYKSRWSIETFFKTIKKHFKIQHCKEKSNCDESINKILCCSSIITNIAVTISKYFETKSYKINLSLMIRYVYDHLLYKIIYGKVSIDDIHNAKYYASVINNTENRHFPRTSKTPFTKWYTKGYSNYAEILKITDAIINNKIKLLDKNKQIIARRIISIKYNNVQEIT